MATDTQIEAAQIEADPNNAGSSTRPYNLPMLVSFRQTQRKTQKRRRYPVLGQVRDVEGALWNVRDIRDTKYCFDLLFGSPDDRTCRVRRPALIPTQPLVDFWEANSTKRTGILFDLPAARATLQRVRRRLGINYHHDLSDFWKERMEDLQALKPREFARRHNVSVSRAVHTRTKVLGRRVRELGWWRAPGPLEILLSNITLREMGEKLCISTWQASRLRARARLL